MMANEQTLRDLETNVSRMTLAVAQIAQALESMDTTLDRMLEVLEAGLVRAYGPGPRRAE